MANQVVAFKDMQLPASVKQYMAAHAGKPADELGAGITTGFAVLSFRGKAWRIKHHGEERVLMNEKGEPRYSIEVVIIRASENISKIFYLEGYSEGSTAPPDCYSIDGKVPEANSPAIQNDICMTCAQNAWGSARGTGKGKACADSKRLAIVPAEDVDNEFFGGPMMLRIPPASLGDLKSYADGLNQMGFPAYAVATRIAFDHTAEYPKLMFSPIEVLGDEDASKVIEMRTSPIVERILNTPVVEGTVAPEKPAMKFEKPSTGAPAKPASNVTPMKPAAVAPKPAAPKPAARPAPAPEPEPEVVEEEQAEEVVEEPKPTPAPAKKANSFAAAASAPAQAAVPAKPVPVETPKAAAPRQRMAATPVKAAAAPAEEVIEDAEAGEVGEVPADMDAMLDEMLGT